MLKKKSYPKTCITIKETETRIYKCRSCKSTNIRKNGYNVSGSLQYYCKDSHTRKVFNPKKGYTEEKKEKIVKSYFERGEYAKSVSYIWSKSDDFSILVKKKQKKLL